MTRPWDRTVKVKPGEKLLLVDGDEEWFVQQTEEGLVVTDARFDRAPLWNARPDRLLLLNRRHK